MVIACGDVLLEGPVGAAAGGSIRAAIGILGGDRDAE